MKKLLKYLKNYKKECVLAPLFKMLEALLELFVPLVVTKIIDVGIANGDRKYVYSMGSVLLLLGLVGLLSSVTAQFFAAKAAIGFGTNARNALFSHIMDFTHREIDSLGTSTLITRLTGDINQVQTGVNMVLRLFLRSPFIVFGSMIMAFTIDVKSALVFVLAIPVLFAVTFGIMALSVPVYKKVQSRLDRITQITRENLSGVRVVRAFGRQEKETEEFENESGALTGLQLFVGRISALLNPLTYVILNFAVIGVLQVGADKVYSGALTQGLVVALVNYMSQILVELIKLSNLVVTINKSLACANRISDVFEENPSVIFPSDPCKKKDENTAVVLDDVTFYYNGSKEPSLENVSFRALTGQKIGIIGATGSGKSTLAELIMRSYDAHSGEVKLFGTDIREYSRLQKDETVSICEQKAVLFSGTLRDNLLVGNENITDSEMLEFLKIAQAENILEAKGNGLDFIIEQDGRNLSGGQRQRIAIARTLCAKTPVIIFDDSTSALDYATETAFRNALMNHAADKTVFIISQRVTGVCGCDRILVLDDGKAVGFGTHGELLESCAEYAEICQSQSFGKEAVS